MDYPMLFMSDNVLAEFDQYMMTEDLSLKSRRVYISDLQQFINYWKAREGESEFKPDQITTLDVIAYRSEMQERELKPNTINRRIISIKKLYAWLVEENRIANNPARKVKPIPSVNRSPRQLTRKEQNAIMRSADRYGSNRDQAIITTMLLTGLRAMEICNLKVSDIQITERKGWLQVRGGKRNKFRRVPLNYTVRDMLTEYLEAAQLKDKDYLFPARNNGEDRLGERGLSYIIKKYARLANVPDVSAHDLRHAFAYNLKGEGVEIERIAKMMGHESINTTAKYGEATDSDLERDIEKISWN